MRQESDVLVVGPGPHVQSDIGADHVGDLEEAKEMLRRHKPALLVVGLVGAEAEALCEFAGQVAPQALWIVCCEGVPPSQIMRWSNFGRLHEVVDNLADPSLEGKVRSALESAGMEQQKFKLVEMFEDQRQQLDRLRGELEARVQKRHHGLRKSLRRLEETKNRLEAFHNALLGVHRASTTLQMEQTLNDALKKAVDLDWVRVRFENQSSLGAQGGPGKLRVEIPLRDEKMPGEVIFAKTGGKRFTPAEVDFLMELTEALALALGRMHKLEQAETLKAQWQATFDSIPHALCLTNRDFEIQKMNLAFQQACSSKTFHSLLGKNCFEMFFSEDFHPPPNMESPFTFRNARSGARETEHFEVVGESLGAASEAQPSALILLRDITNDVRFERRILEASKLAELGTIGSSIAHELNNPLGGMLSFLQLILMDMREPSALKTEIAAMEKAVLRCRDIVLNLLSFARKQDLGEFSPIDLWVVVDRAVKLIELQSKSMGIAIDLDRDGPCLVRGSVNALSQALCNILQNSIDAIGEKLKQDPLFPGRIAIHLARQTELFQLQVSDNGMGIKPENQTQVFNPLFTTRDPGVNSGMGLTTAYTIVSEHGGTLEILSQTGSGTTAIVALPPLKVG